VTQHLPLAVDMDGCLIATDMLMEALAAAMFRRPMLALSAPVWLARGGRPLLKQKLAHANLVDVAHLPLRADFVAYLRVQKVAGRGLHLVSASDQAAVNAVAAQLALFDSATGSDGRTNLKAKAKRAFLEQRFPGGFVYAGDSCADLAVWPAAAAALPSGAGRKVMAELTQRAIACEAAFPAPPPSARDWAGVVGLTRLGGALVCFAAGPVHGWISAGAASISLASALACVHLLNAVARVQSDRRAFARRDRPLAAGRISLAAALRAAPALAALAIAAGVFAVAMARGP